MNKIVKLAINFLLIAIIIAAISVGTWVMYRYEQEVNSLLAPPIVDEETLDIASESGQAMARRIMTEGAIMLKNDGALPLDYSTDKQVNVFGWRSVDWIYGSEGFNASGGVAPENDNFDENVDIYKALNKYGIRYNTELYDMYYRYVKPDHQSADLRGVHISTLISLREPKIDDKEYYSDDLLSRAQEYSDTAIVVIGRMSGEGMNADTTKQDKEGPGVVSDGTRHYLEISTEEEALLTYCGANFENVIVIMNVSNPFEMGFLETIPGIDACLYVGFTGTRAAQALPGLLYGDTSPSGRTVDTFAYDLWTNPANVFKGGLSYTDYGRSYADYVENVYVGYKWYETADAEGIWNDVSNVHGTGYEGVVQFPFGHGMSYNEYSWEVGEITAGDGPIAEGGAFTDKTKFTIPVTVTNNGDYPGRDVVEVYVTPPYTDGEIEKASVTLAGYGKTNELQPGASETIEITVDPYDFASYDCYDKNKNNFKGWELDEGTYTFSLRTDAHTVKTVTYGGSERAGSFDYKVASDITIPLDPVTQKEVKNLFTGADAVDTTPLDATEKKGSFDPGIPWLTRSDFMDPSEFQAHNVARAATPSAKISGYSAERAIDWDKAKGNDEFGEPIPTEKPTWGNGGSLRLADGSGNITDLGKQLGADYDDPKWEDVLNQVTIAEAVELVNGYYSSDAIATVGKPRLVDYDGPAQIKGFTTAPRGTGYPTMVVIAAAWNPSLAYEFGKAYGEDMDSVGVSGLWGWAIDCHRTAWFGRNHESPSEDAMLAGTTIANAVRGLNTRGKYNFIKHFALYGYGGDSIWVTEQAFREIYLRSYRKAFVDGGALGAMTTYQGIGAEHSETTIALLTGVLRREWDFKGAITTDAIGTNPYCDSILRAGGNFGMGVELGTLKGVTYNADSSARIQHRLRDSVHQVLYMWLRADYNESQYLLNPDEGDSFVSSTSINGWEWWKPFITTVDICVGVLCVMWAALVIISILFKKNKNKAPRVSEVYYDLSDDGDASESEKSEDKAAPLVGSAAPADFAGAETAAAIFGGSAAVGESAETAEESAAAAEDASASGIPEGETLSFADAFGQLPEDAKTRFKQVEKYALNISGAEEKATGTGVTVKIGSKRLVRLKVRRGRPVAFFDMESDELRSYRKESGIKFPHAETMITLDKDDSVTAACRMIDMAAERAQREKEQAAERRREARRKSHAAKEDNDEHME